MRAQTLNPLKLNFNQLNVEWDVKTRTFWCRMRPGPRPCFTPELLKDLDNLPGVFEACGITQDQQWGEPVHAVFSSDVPGVFNLGGDLNLFLSLIKRKDRDGLDKYATACIDQIHATSIGFGLPITTIGVVQGQAMGGGMEGALALNYLIAERQVTMGLPEVLFNLFPGMGAYNFLSRRLGPIKAEEMIMSGRTWNAEELYEMGVVDCLAEEGEGFEVARKLIRNRRRHATTAAAMRQVRQRVDAVSKQDLMDVVKIWVDAALQLSNKDLRIMERLVRAQNKLVGTAGSPGPQPWTGQASMV